MRVKVHHVNRKSQAIYAGVVSKKTHVICRSRSSRIFWLVQVYAVLPLFVSDAADVGLSQTAAFVISHADVYAAFSGLTRAVCLCWI